MRLPSWLGTLATRRGQVAEVEDLGARLRRVAVAGPELRDLRPFTAGQELGLKLARGWRSPTRTYSGLAYDAASGRVELVAYLHGLGPATRMLAGLATGDELELWGFDGQFVLDPAARTHVCLGDETTMGAFAAMARALPAGHELGGAVEVDASAVEPARAALLRLALPCAVLPRARPGDALCDWLRHARLADDARLYLAGRGQSIVALRRVLAERGIAPARARVRAFWVEGRAYTPQP